MEHGEYQRLFELEETLWWFRGMERISTTLLDRFVGDGPLRILDAGCGTGGMLQSLRGRGWVTGVDASAEALRLGRQRSDAVIVRGSVDALPFRSASFDLVTSFDVIYHRNVPDDEKALSEIARVLRPGGTLLIRVPAFEKLRSRHDEAVHTRQRYEKSELTDKVIRSGLETIFTSFANCLLFPVALVRRSAERWRAPRRDSSEVEAVSPLLDRVLYLPLRTESWLLKWAPLPFGLSLVVVARKPAKP